MTMRFKAKATLAAVGTALALSVATPAYALSFIGLYNTGFDAAGNPVAAGGADGNYTITSDSNPGFVSPASAFVTTGVSSWTPNSPTSSWITPFVNADGSAGPSTGLGPAFTYDYTMDFDLGDVSAADAILTGMVQSDNYVEIYLNDVFIGGQAPVPSPGDTAYFSTFTAFGTGSGFQAGMNTLRFTVTDYGVVTGLRVDALAGSAVPEPGVWAMLIVGFGLVAGQIRRRRRLGTMAIA